MKPWSFLDTYRGTAFTGRWPTIPQLFEITCSRFPENLCFTSFDPEELRLSYAEALARVKKVASYLRERGIRPGDRVAVSGKNSPEWAVAYLAVLFAAGVVVPLDYQLKDDELRGLIGLSGSRLFFVDEERFDLMSSDSGARAGADFLGIVSLSARKKPYVFELEEGDGRGAGAGDGDEAHGTDASQLAAILYTSGTTGRAKGVMLSHENLVADCLLAQTLISIDSSEVFYALLPIHHSYTMLAVFIEAISSGAQIVFGKRMVVKQILSDLERGKVTMFLGIPMLYNKLLKGIMHGIREKGALVYALIRVMMAASGAIKRLLGLNPGRILFRAVLKQASLDHVRVCICGGGPLPSETFRRFNQLGINFVQGYGLTETSPIVTLNPIEHYKESSVGKLLPEVEVKIADPDEEGIGEILIRGPIVMRGYYENPGATSDAITPDGFLKTGDVGYLDRENYLFLTGRKKNLIVTEGGKNVFPEEIEDLFQLYDEVEQVMVRGYLSDPKMQIEAIEALVFPDREFIEEAARKDGAEADDAYVNRRISQVIEKVNAQLLPYKRISRVRLLDEALEMTTTRKIKRFKVADPS